MVRAVTPALLWSLLLSTQAPVQDLRFSPASLVFPATYPGQSAGPLWLTVVNGGETARELTAFSLGGDHAADFTIATNPCQGALEPRERCTIQLVFRPGGEGARRATLTVTATGATPMTAALRGQALAAPEKTALPGEWASHDIGDVGRMGTATHAKGVFTVQGAGADIWDRADAFHFASRPLAGSGAVVARVADIRGAQAWTKAGVMIRASLDPDAAHAYMLVSKGKGTAFQRRAAKGRESEHTPGPNATAPQWVRLERRDSTVVAAVSADGQAWTEVGRAQIELGEIVHAGLAVSSHDPARVATAVFDTVVVRSP